MADACDVRQRARVGPSQVAEPQEAGCLYGVPQTQVRHRYSVVPHLVRAVLTDGGEQRLVLGAPAERAGELGPVVELALGESPVESILFDRVGQQVLRSGSHQPRPQQHAGQRPRGVGAAAETEDVDRVAGPPVLHHIPVGLCHIVFEAHPERLLVQQAQLANQRRLPGRQGSHTGVVVGDLGRIVLVQHLEELGDVGEIAGADLVRGAVKAEDYPLGLWYPGHLQNFTWQRPCCRVVRQRAMIATGCRGA